MYEIEVYCYEIVCIIIYILFFISVVVELWLEREYRNTKKLDINLDATEDNSRNNPKKRKTSKGTKFVVISIIIYLILFFVVAPSVQAIQYPIIWLLPQFFPSVFVIGVIINLVEYLKKK